MGFSTRLFYNPDWKVNAHYERSLLRIIDTKMNSAQNLFWQLYLASVGSVSVLMRVWWITSQLQDTIFDFPKIWKQNSKRIMNLDTLFSDVEKAQCYNLEKFGLMQCRYFASRLLDYFFEVALSLCSLNWIRLTGFMKNGLLFCLSFSHLWSSWQYSISN